MPMLGCGVESFWHEVINPEWQFWSPRSQIKIDKILLNLLNSCMFWPLSTKWRPINFKIPASSLMMAHRQPLQRVQQWVVSVSRRRLAGKQHWSVDCSSGSVTSSWFSGPSAHVSIIFGHELSWRPTGIADCARGEDTIVHTKARSLSSFPKLPVSGCQSQLVLWGRRTRMCSPTVYLSIRWDAAPWKQFLSDAILFPLKKMFFCSEPQK